MTSKAQDDSILGKVLESLQTIIKNQTQTDLKLEEIDDRLESIEKTLHSIKRNEIIVDKEISTLYTFSSSHLSRTTEMKETIYLIEQRLKSLEG